MAQGNAKLPRMRHPAATDGTGAGPVQIGETVPSPTIDSKWHPTVLMLLAILVVEVAAFAALRYTFSKL